MAEIIQPHLNKQRQDKFLLILSIPQILRTINTRNIREDQYINLDSLQFSLFDIQIPRSTVPEIPVHYGQQNYNVTSYNRPAYPPVNVSFEVDNEFKNYWVLWKWLQLLNDPLNAQYAGKNMFPNGAPPSTFIEYNKLLQDFGTEYIDGNRYQPNRKHQIEYYYNYVTTINVLSLDEYNNERAKFIFKYAFITELGELTYNYRESGQLGTQFTFVFNQMDMELLGDNTERM